MSMGLTRETDADQLSGNAVVLASVPDLPAEPAATVAAAAPLAVRVVRRTLDLALASVVLLLVAPIMLAVALAIRLDSPGPALFRQRRVGRGMGEFTVLKFRSMAAAADSARHRLYVTGLITGNADQQPDGDGLYKLAADDRVTSVGRFLRKTSLDELPQLFNVLRGEMSLVGPRPVIPYEVEQYPKWYRARFAVRPGMTGLWQVSGRNERTYEEMVRLDIEYAERQSLGLDLKILLKTIRVVLSGRGVA
jgi:lipopolysaccharide/colanic/teichoic acid biosynthesis glycosyltransferase